MDYTGKYLFQMVPNHKTLDRNIQIFNMEKFSLLPGNYIIKMNMNDKIYTKKIIKIN